MSASYERWVHVESPMSDELAFGVAARAASGVGVRMPISQSPDRHAEFNVPMSLRSWGERVELDQFPRAIRIASRCTFPLQVVDWGKNRSNVERIESALLLSLAANARASA